MSLKVQRILEDLADDDAEVQTLALTTITRIALADDATPEQMGTLRRRINELSRSPNGDVAFLAKKAANHVDSGGRQRKQGPRREGPPPAARSGPELLAELAAETDPTAQATLLANLRSSGEPRVLQEVKRFLQHPDDRVRANAVEVFEALGDGSHIRLILPLLRDGNNRVRSNVVKALGRFGDPQVMEYLTAMLESTQVSMRESAMYAAEQLERPDMEPLFLRAIRDRYEGVRLRALRALSRSQSDAALEAMKGRLDDDDAGVRQEASRLLAARGIDVETLLEKKHEAEDATGMPYISTPPLRPSAEEVRFIARVGERVDRALRREILNISRQLGDLELRARLSRLLFKAGVEIFELCRRGEIKEKTLLVHYYDVLRFQQYLRELGRREPAAEGSVTEATHKAYRTKMRASFIRLGKAFAHAHRKSPFAIDEIPELREYLRIVEGGEGRGE